MSMMERQYHFKCPECGGEMKVKNVRHKGRFMIIRYRVCDSCGCKKATVERFRRDRASARLIEQQLSKGKEK